MLKGTTNFVYLLHFDAFFGCSNQFIHMHVCTKTLIIDINSCVGSCMEYINKVFHRNSVDCGITNFLFCMNFWK